MKFLFALLFTSLILFFTHCKKEGSYFPNNDNNAPDTTSSVFNYISLIVTPDTAKVGDIINIVATATGKNLLYTWSTSHGNLFGAGYHVESSADPCCVGRIKVWCTITDNIHTETKEVFYSVIP